MHNLKEIRKDPDLYQKKLRERNIDFNIKELITKDEENRTLIKKKETLEQEKKKLSKTKDPKNFENCPKCANKRIFRSFRSPWT